jgi:hypothetical protein
VKVAALVIAVEDFKGIANNEGKLCFNTFFHSHFLTVILANLLIILYVEFVTIDAVECRLELSKSKCSYVHQKMKHIDFQFVLLGFRQIVGKVIVIFWKKLKLFE